MIALMMQKIAKVKKLQWQVKHYGQSALLLNNQQKKGSSRHQRSKHLRINPLRVLLLLGPSHHLSIIALLLTPLMTTLIPPKLGFYFAANENLFLYIPPLSTHPQSCLKSLITGEYWRLKDSHPQQLLHRRHLLTELEPILYSTVSFIDNKTYNLPNPK
jgi:hypothetical protein